MNCYICFYPDNNTKITKTICCNQLMCYECLNSIKKEKKKRKPLICPFCRKKKLKLKLIKTIQKEPLKAKETIKKTNVITENLLPTTITFDSINNSNPENPENSKKSKINSSRSVKCSFCNEFNHNRVSCMLLKNIFEEVKCYYDQKIMTKEQCKLFINNYYNKKNSYSKINNNDLKRHAKWI